MSDFVSSQILTDEQWKAFAAHPNHSNNDSQSVSQSVAAQLRPLLEEGMQKDMEEVDAITNNAEAPTFDNTIVALSRSGEKLDRATTIMYNLLSAETDDELDELSNEMAAKLSEHDNNIMLNEKLFSRVKYVYEHELCHLRGEDLTLLKDIYQGFERSGANLSGEKKETYRKLTKELSEKTLKFSQNLLKETNNFILHVTREEDLAGLADMYREAAAQEAETRGLSGWVFTLHAPSYIPFMTFADNRELREKLCRAYVSRCTHDNEYNNENIVRDIVNLRRKKAQLLGYKDYADFALRRRMAQDSKHVYKLLNDLIESYLPKAKEEVAEVERKAQAIEGKDFRLMPWDFSYYSHKLKTERYDFDTEWLRPYFQLENVQKGVFGLATKLYGIRFVENKQIPVYQNDVKAFDVLDKDGSFLANLLVDFFPRASKKGGAWMTNYREEHCDEPTHVKVTAENSFRPVVSITTNFTKPTKETPSLLSLDEVETFLHEFGHALHGIFAMTHYKALSGTSVYWDFVELPSQFMENYAREPEFLSTFAYHYQTHEPIPEDYIRRMIAAKNYLSAYYCMRQVSFGLLDMAYYTLADELKEKIKKFEDAAWSRVQMLPSVDSSCMTVQFSHIMSGGYAAGYYSYKWAEVLDADAFSLFKQRGIFDEKTASSFRHNLLEKGGTQPPMELYVKFRGQEPSIDALLKRDGLK